MATHDYYNPSSTPRPHGGDSDGPLPPLPHDPYAAYSSHPTQPSPRYMSSPTHDDTSYRPYADQSQQSLQPPYYSSGGGGREHEPSAYSDDIPLRNNQSKQSSDLAIHDMPDDPAIMYRPSRSAARKPKRKGFFGNKIPWVVYVLTIIQVAVFI